MATQADHAELDHSVWIKSAYLCSVSLFLGYSLCILDPIPRPSGKPPPESGSAGGSRVSPAPAMGSNNYWLIRRMNWATRAEGAPGCIIFAFALIKGRKVWKIHGECKVLGKYKLLCQIVIITVAYFCIFPLCVLCDFHIPLAGSISSLQNWKQT